MSSAKLNKLLSVLHISFNPDGMFTAESLTRRHLAPRLSQSKDLRTLYPMWCRYRAYPAKLDSLLVKQTPTE